MEYMLKKFPVVLAAAFAAIVLPISVLADQAPACKEHPGSAIRLKSNVSYLAPENVLGLKVSGETMTFSMAKNAQTESLNAGSLVASQSGYGLLGRVQSVKVLANDVSLVTLFSTRDEPVESSQDADVTIYSKDKTKTGIASLVVPVCR